MKTKFAGLLTAVMIAALLSACGGGGGGGGDTGGTPVTPLACTAPQVVSADGKSCVTPALTCTAPQVLSSDGKSCVAPTVDVTCPNGTKQTAATAALANAACAAPKVTSISPADGSSSASPDAFAGITVATDSTLDPTTINGTNVTLTIGSNTVVAGTVSADGTKGFKFVPTAKLSYGQAYSFGFAGVKDALGRALDKSSSVFTTASIACTAPKVPAADGNSCVDPAPVIPTCTAPQTYDAVLKSCVSPVNVKITGLNQIPATALTIDSADWTKAVADGTVKFVDSGIKMTGTSNSARAIVFAVYKNGLTGSSCTKFLFKDDGTGVISNSTSGGGCNTTAIDWVDGTSVGIIRHTPTTNQCYQITYNQATTIFDDTLIACPF